MKLIGIVFLGVAFLSTTLNGSAQTPQLEWAKGIGGTGSTFGTSIGIDALGNVYTTGQFNGTTDFNPGPGLANLTAVGIDIFISKLDANGNFVWANRIGSTGTDSGNAIAVDASGNQYITGVFNGTADFDPGAGTSNLISAGVGDIFILKLDASGVFQWAQKIGSTGADEGNSISVDPSGDILLTGKFAGTVDFDPSAVGTTNLVSLGGSDIFITKFNSSGNFIWAKSIGSTGADVGNSVTTDISGNVFTTGTFVGTVDFDPGAGTTTLTSAILGTFILKLNGLGNFIVAKAFSGTSGVTGESISVDGAGNIYTTGDFGGTIDFDPGAGVFNLTEVSSGDIFISKLDASGNFLWAKGFGNNQEDGGRSITIDALGNSYTTGHFTSTVDFDPGAGVFNLVSTTASSYDIFILKLDPAGNFSWAVRMGGTDDFEIGESIVVDGPGNIYTTGQFSSVADFDPNSGIFNLTGAGTSDNAFIVKLNITNFVTQWNLATAGSGANQLSFGTATSGAVSYTWQQVPAGASGSGTWSGATLTITGLPTGATIRLQIAPANFQRIIINSGADRNRLTQVEQWGTTAWASMQLAFRNCANMQVTATDVPNLSGVSNMSGMFSGCSVLNSPSNIGSWNTSVVTDMSSLFSSASAFNQNISLWNTAAVANMFNMFADAAAFNQDIGAWNTSSVTNMAAMFAGAIVFNRNIGAWNTAAVTNMNSMFFSAYVFNQNISGWNTLAVTNMSSMFGYAYAFNQNIGTWNTSAVTNMSRMFEDAFNFNQTIGTWNTSAVTTMRGMFIDAYDFNKNIGTWNTLAVTDMSRMFDFATAFNQNIGTWNTAAVTDMSGMFADASAFNQNIGNWSLNPGVNLTGMLNNSNMDCNNYSATLIGWSANPLTPINRSLGAVGRQYGTNADAARNNLDVIKGWTITGDTPSGSSCVASCVPASQRNSLIALYNSTDGDNWTNTLANNAKWTGADESTWFGVTVNSCNITEVSLGNNNLTGFIPIEIKDLPNLTNLALSENKLSGGIPVELGNLSSLRYLDLLSNQLTGTIPDQLGNITTLEGLNLSQNLLSGTIPISLASPPVLSFIELYSNQLTGTIPAQLGNAPSLAFLRLSDNQLTGSIPTTFGNLTQLFLLDLEQNLLTGPIPTEFGNLTLLKILNLYDNQLTGPIPTTFGNLTSLETLNIFTNQLSGTLPIELALCTQLKHLEVAENLFTGTLPIAYQSLIYLEIFQINNNSFTGPVPIEYLAWTNIKELYLSTNQLDAIPTFPPALITNLAVENNKLDFGDLEPNIGTAGYTYAPQANLTGGTITLCEGTSLTIPFVTPGTANSYQWYKNGVLITGATSATYSKSNAAPFDAGNYTVQITSSLVPGLTLQSDNFTVSISIVAKPVIITSNCTATSATLSGPAGLSIYAWSNGANTQQISITSPGSYTLTVTNGSGCVSVPSDATTFTATFCNQPPVITTTPISTTVEGTVTVLLSSLLSDPDGNLDLSTLKIVKQPTSGATASLDASSQLILNYAGRLFSGTDELTIEVCDFSGQCVQQVLAVEVIGDITIYNGISPNGDGLNDTWLILYIDVLTETKENKVFVYNRWGDVVFETENYDNKDIVFKGLNKNENELSSGTYFYKIEFSSGRKTLNGYISLKR